MCVCVRVCLYIFEEGNLLNFNFYASKHGINCSIGANEADGKRPKVQRAGHLFNRFDGYKSIFGFETLLRFVLMPFSITLKQGKKI